MVIHSKPFLRALTLLNPGLRRNWRPPSTETNKVSAESYIDSEQVATLSVDSPKPLASVEAPPQTVTSLSGSETVNHPQHYGGDTPYEAIKVIEAWQLGFHLGNTVKYIARAKWKGNMLEDLKKARWYLDRFIQLLEKK